MSQLYSEKGNKINPEKIIEAILEFLQGMNGGQSIEFVENPDNKTSVKLLKRLSEELTEWGF